MQYSSSRTKVALPGIIQRTSELVGLSIPSFIEATIEISLPALTDLAWIRTSLSLASIGIAITQLFRLGSAVVSGPSLQLSTSLPFIKRSGAPGQLILSSLSSPPTLTLEKLYSLIQSQQAQINALTASCQSIQNPAYDPEKYRYLGKPVGGTFIMLALLFLQYVTTQTISLYSINIYHNTQPRNASILSSSICFDGVSIGISSKQAISDCSYVLHW